MNDDIQDPRYSRWLNGGWGTAAFILIFYTVCAAYVLIQNINNLTDYQFYSFIIPALILSVWAVLDYNMREYLLRIPNMINKFIEYSKSLAIVVGFLLLGLLFASIVVYGTYSFFALPATTIIIILLILMLLKK